MESRRCIGTQEHRITQTNHLRDTDRSATQLLHQRKVSALNQKQKCIESLPPLAFVSGVSVSILLTGHQMTCVGARGKHCTEGIRIDGDRVAPREAKVGFFNGNRLLSVKTHATWQRVRLYHRPYASSRTSFLPVLSTMQPPPSWCTDPRPGFCCFAAAFLSND